MSSERLGCPSIIFGKSFPRVGQRSSPDDDYKQGDVLPYRLKDAFLTPAEISFYHVLRQMVGNYLIIIPQAPLASIVFVTTREDYYKYYNQIDRKRVDFLLCRPDTLQPVFAIELDDSSHLRPDRAERDVLVEKILATASLPLVRIHVRQSYNLEELGLIFKNTLQKQASKGAEQGKTQATTGAHQPPICPKCNIPMVLRIARRGNQAGERFWGCTNYPNCREMIKITSD